MDIEKQVGYWRESALGDLDTAALLIRNTKINQGLFFAHLALEKGLKALACRTTRRTPPFIHDLTRLAQLSGVSLTEERKKFIARVSTFNIRGRYEMPTRALMSASEAQEMVDAVGEWIEWLMRQ